MSTISSPRSSGKRDKDAERRARILAAARKSFIGRGFQRTSLDHIIAETGGSRRNIYDLFGDKEGLFEAVLKDLMGEILEQADVLPSPGAPPRDWLIEFGRGFLKGMAAPVVIAAFRQFITVAADRPDLGREAYESGPVILHNKLKQYLDTEVAAGRLVLKDTGVAARILPEMLKGDFQLRALMTGSSHVSEQEIERHVTQVVDLFLNGALPRPKTG